MNIVSMVPSATEILCALGLAADIVGISHDCDYPAEILNRPRITATTLGPDLSSYQIDEKVRASASAGHSLYLIQAELLEKLNPDLVITQEQCSMCAVDRQRTLRALQAMQLKTDWLSLSATGFSGLYDDLVAVGSATGRAREAQRLVSELSVRLDYVAHETALAERPNVFCLSWFDPLMAAGNWITQMVNLAGGDDRLGAGGVASSRIVPEDLLREPPQFIFLLPCSFSQTRTGREWAGICDSAPWVDLPAVREGRVFTLESNLFHRPGPRLVDGVELMAALLHPDRCSFSAEPHLSRRVA